MGTLLLFFPRTMWCVPMELLTVPEQMLAALLYIWLALGGDPGLQDSADCPSLFLEKASGRECWKGSKLRWGEVRWEAAGERQSRSGEGGTAGVWNNHFHQQPAPVVVLSHHAVQAWQLGHPQLVSPWQDLSHQQWDVNSLALLHGFSWPFHVRPWACSQHRSESNCTPDSVFILTPHTTAMHVFYGNGPSATHALHQQKLLLEKEILWQFLVMNTPSYVSQWQTSPAIAAACTVDGSVPLLSLAYLPISWFLDIC